LFRHSVVLGLPRCLAFQNDPCIVAQRAVPAPKLAIGSPLKTVQHLNDCAVETCENRRPNYTPVKN
jgi:hypothetical protein